MDDDKHRIQAAISTVVIAVTWAGTLYLIWRMVSGPDGGKRVTMQTAKTWEHFCQRQAESWAHAADNAKRVYDRARTVSV